MTLSRTLRVSLVFLACRSSIFALDPNQSLGQLYHTSWNAREGVNGSVTALAQTTDGYLWVGTTDGLLRFDGISFEQFRPENGSLIATSVSALLAVPDGGLWVGFSRGGASLVKNGQVTNYSDSEGFPVSTVRCFARDRSGVVWAAAVGGFARLEGQRWQKIRSAWNYPTKTAWMLMVDRDGTLWVTTGSELVFLPDREKRFQSTGIQTGEASVLVQAPDGAIWFSDDRQKKLRSFRLDNAGKVDVSPDINIAANTAVFDRDGALWVGGDGLSRIRFPKKVSNSRLTEFTQKFTVAKGLSDESVDAVLEDREGNIWVGTDGGLDRFRNRNVTWFPLRGGPFTLVAGSSRDVWAGSRGDSPLVRVGDPKTAARQVIDVLTAYRDPDGSIWFAANHSLMHWENGRVASIPVPHQVLQMSLAATPPDPISASSITQDASGSVWVSFGGSGEYRLKNGIWNFMQILPDHPDWSANYAFTDKADCVWLCWGDRVARYDHGNIQLFGAREGLAIGPPNLIAGGNQQIWVGGESGLSLFQGGRFHTIQSNAGSSFRSISGIVATGSGGLWLSTAHGIVHIPEAEIDRVIQHPEHKVAFELFDLISDLPEPIQQRGELYSSGAIRANDGAIWFATRNGAVRVDPAHIYRNPLPPPVSIRSIVADEKSYSPFSNPTLPALTKNLRIEYAALSLSIPERVRFRYKLEGWDNQWHEAGSQRGASFTNLAPAKYSFRVIACNNDGVWNKMGATLNFSIAPAWFQTTSFRAFCVALLLVPLWCLYQLRLRQLQQKFNIRLEERVNERTRIARELHDTVLQSLHGLMMSFQRAANLLPERPVEAKQRLEAAIDQAGQAITEGRDAVQGLRSSAVVTNDIAAAIQTLGQELAAKETNRDCPIFHVAVEGTQRELNPILRDDVYRIAGEAVRNSFRHAQARRIEVEIHYDQRQLRLRIRDDGKGIDKQVFNSKRRSGHWGLPGMGERAELVGGHLEIWSELDCGTEIELRIPASIAYVSSLPRNREKEQH